MHRLLGGEGQSSSGRLTSSTWTVNPGLNPASLPRITLPYAPIKGHFAKSNIRQELPPKHLEQNYSGFGGIRIPQRRDHQAPSTHFARRGPHIGGGAPGRAVGSVATGTAKAPLPSPLPGDLQLGLCRASGFSRKRLPVANVMVWSTVAWFSPRNGLGCWSRGCLVASPFLLVGCQWRAGSTDKATGGTPSGTPTPAGRDAPLHTPGGRPTPAAPGGGHRYLQV